MAITAATGTREGARSIWTWLRAVLADGADLDLQAVIEKLEDRNPTSPQGRRAHEALITALIWGLEANGFALGNLADSRNAIMRDGTVDELLAKSLEFVDVARRESFPGVLRLPNPRAEALLEFFADPHWIADQQALTELETLVRRYRQRNTKPRDPAD
jgi:hypothetical protein